MRASVSHSNYVASLSFDERVISIQEQLHPRDTVSSFTFLSLSLSPCSLFSLPRPPPSLSLLPLLISTDVEIIRARTSLKCPRSSHLGPPLKQYGLCIARMFRSPKVSIYFGAGYISVNRVTFLAERHAGIGIFSFVLFEGLTTRSLRSFHEFVGWKKNTDNEIDRSSLIGDFGKSRYRYRNKRNESYN